MRELSERLKNSGLDVKYSSELKKHLCLTGFEIELENETFTVLRGGKVIL